MIPTPQKARVWLSAALAISTALALQAEPRTFTSPDGRTLQGEIQSATLDMVTLKLANGGAPLAAPINKFSEADQAFIAEWRKANPVAIKYGFSAAFTKDKRDSNRRTSGGTEVTNEKWLCNVKLANRSGQTLEGMKVDYEIYYTEANGNASVPRKMKGTSDLPAMKHLEEIVFQTKEVQLTTTKLVGGYYYIDGTRSRKKDAIDGVTIKITHEGQTAFEWASYGVPKDRGGATQ